MAGNALWVLIMETLRSQLVGKSAFILIVLLLVGAASAQTATTITLDQAIDLALAHSHTLKAARTQIDQNKAQEITAALRPNPNLTADGLFIPVFTPSNFNSE